MWKRWRWQWGPIHRKSFTFKAVRDKVLSENLIYHPFAEMMMIMMNKKMTTECKKQEMKMTMMMMLGSENFCVSAYHHTWEAWKNTSELRHDCLRIASVSHPRRHQLSLISSLSGLKVRVRESRSFKFKQVSHFSHSWSFPQKEALIRIFMNVLWSRSGINSPLQMWNLLMQTVLLYM